MEQPASSAWQAVRAPHSGAAARRWVIVLTLGLLGVAGGVAMAAWDYQTHANADRAAVIFSARADKVALAVRQRIDDIEAIMLGARGLVTARGAALSAAEWRAYVATLGGETFRNDVRSLTFLKRVGSERQAAFAAARRAEGDDPTFSIHDVGEIPAGDNPVLITYIEPVARRNAVTLGADVSSDAKRRVALRAARDQNRVVATLPTRLIDEAASASTDYVVLYAPAYRFGGDPGTVEGRQRELLGYVGSAVNLPNLIGVAVARMDDDLLEDFAHGLKLSLDDVTDEARPVPVWAQSAVWPNRSLLSTIRTIPVGGRIWAVTVTAPAALYSRGMPRPGAVAAAAALIGALVAGLAGALASLWLKGRAIGQINRELRRRDEELRQLAISDPLTGLFNRRQFHEVGILEWRRMHRNGAPLVVLMVDADHFKAVNDTYGHAAGDAVLVALAERLRRAVRECDLVGRIGGEEFAVLLPETTPETGLIVAERLRRAVSSLIVPVEGHVLRVTVSVGLAVGQLEDSDFATVMARADQALYTAKRTGRNRVALEPRIADLPAE